MAKQMGHFTATGMRTKVPGKNLLIINTCGKNDTAERGEFTSWAWSNPTNRAIKHLYREYEAVSVECLWQGIKVFTAWGQPDELTLQGDWRRGKGKRPVGAYNGPKTPLITTPGEARVKIYIPAFKRLIEHWLQDEQVAEWLQQARDYDGDVYLRDFDTGRGVHRNGPMSHAWLMCEWLNTGRWPGLEE